MAIKPVDAMSGTLHIVAKSSAEALNLAIAHLAADGSRAPEFNDVKVFDTHDNAINDLRHNPLKHPGGEQVFTLTLDVRATASEA
ncbi:hypothetical protein [Streptomyces sp. NPDC002402]